MRGHVGGGEAAARLNNQILDYALLSDERLQQGCKILARVYVDVKKISEAYCKAGLVSHPSVIENFVAGFNAYDSHFELVHVSSGGSGSATRIYGKCILTLVTSQTDRRSRHYQATLAGSTLSAHVPRLCQHC